MRALVCRGSAAGIIDKQRRHDGHLQIELAQRRIDETASLIEWRRGEPKGPATRGIAAKRPLDRRYFGAKATRRRARVGYGIAVVLFAIAGCAFTVDSPPETC